MKKLIKLGLIVSLAVAFLFVSMTQFGLFGTKDTTITAVYALDINPSFEISVNKQDKVVLITAVNDDALTITVDDLYGKDSAYVIEELLKRAKEAGFIDDTDLVDDYVVLTTIPMTDEDEDQTDELEDKVEKRIKDSEFLSGLNVAVIKGDLVTLRLAEGKKVPIGLYVINGMVKQPDGTYLSAKEFFSNPEYRATFQTQHDIKTAKLDRVKARILEALDQLDLAGVDTTELRTALETATGIDLIDLMADVRALKKDNHISNPAEDNEIEHGKPENPGNPKN
jgi:hypothetical protein